MGEEIARIQYKNCTMVFIEQENEPTEESLIDIHEQIAKIIEREKPLV